MTKDFNLHKALAHAPHIVNLSLCSVLLEDNAYFPWILLVPRKNDVKNMLGLTMDERIHLMREIAVCEKAMYEVFNPTQINVAAIGNITPQLHVHIVCRFENDHKWPGTVWGKKSKPYTEDQKRDIIEKIRNAIQNAS